MIVVDVKKQNNQILNIKMTGHAEYADYGKDIVCAAASSILITSVNAILKFDKDAITVNQDDFVEIIVKKHDSVTDSLIENLIDLLLDLQRQYKKNIKINI